jgi:hypothetical protein
MLFGISIAPLVNCYEEILAKHQAQAWARQVLARTALRTEIGALRQTIRQASRRYGAGRAYPAQRANSCVTSIERLEQTGADPGSSVGRDLRAVR